MAGVTPLEPAASPASDADGAASAVARTLRLGRGVRLEVAAQSSPAPHHRVNEDAHSALDEGSRLFVVADGVGGGAMAALASSRLVAGLHARLGRGGIDAAAIGQAVRDADREVRELIAAHTAEPGAATLALCAPADRAASDWWIGWVGDCRVYRVGTGREEPARLLTLDDSYRHLDEAPPAGGSPDDPARMVGNGAVERPNAQRVALGRGERLLLCSDGVHKHLTPHRIGQLLQAERPLLQRCDDLVAAARAAGSRDDATVLVVERRAVPWLAWLIAGALAATLLLLGGLALWNAYGLGGHATPPVFDGEAPAAPAAPPFVAPPPGPAEPGR